MHGVEEAKVAGLFPFSDFGHDGGHDCLDPVVVVGCVVGVRWVEAFVSECLCCCE